MLHAYFIDNEGNCVCSSCVFILDDTEATDLPGLDYFEPAYLSEVDGSDHPTCVICGDRIETPTIIRQEI